MALSADLDQTRLNWLAPQIGASVTRFMPLAAGTRVEIGEAFEVWALSSNGKADDGLAGSAMPTGRHYLLIYVGDGAGGAMKPAAVASVVDIETEKPRVAGLFDTWFAEALGEAIVRVDASDRVAGDVVGRLLIAPAHRVQGLWFHRPDEEWIYVVSAPNDLDGVHRGQWLRLQPLMTALASAPSVIGVIED